MNFLVVILKIILMLIIQYDELITNFNKYENNEFTWDKFIVNKDFTFIKKI